MKRVDEYKQAFEHIRFVNIRLDYMTYNNENDGQKLYVVKFVDTGLIISSHNLYRLFVDNLNLALYLARYSEKVECLHSFIKRILRKYHAVSDL